ncbi:unnamed protein product, partial [Didymodactylos carnosus]
TIVIVSSDLHKRGLKQSYEYIENLNAGNYGGMAVYSQTKLFNLLFANYLLKSYLPKHYDKYRIKVATLHPGFIPTTELSRQIQNRFLRIVMQRILPILPITTTVEDGARRIYKAATDPESNGRYIGNGNIYVEEHVTARDQTLAKQLWDRSCELLDRQDWIS